MNQEMLNKLTGHHIHAYVSGQVDRELAAQSAVAESLLAAMSQAVDDEDGDPPTVYEWWTVSEEFAMQAELLGEVIVETPFGVVWGRQTTGIGLGYDAIVCNILQRI
ncbi:MAG: hypothetical protein KQH59_12885 [Desulfobulbaceae bacterium]|nr:hypothetical protein [Desulfobulbaceae bacterium]